MPDCGADIVIQAGAAGPPRTRDRPLLPNEPRILDEARQQALTERFLLPAAPALEALFLALRADLDPDLSRAWPSRPAKPYPLGRCLEISQAVERRLAQLEPGMLQGPAATGLAALAAFARHGGDARRVWGDLRGRYFQNAFLFGTLYVDVANDTVVATKPKVEILSFAESGLGPVEDFRHFARRAAGYWRAAVFPNHLLPELAPYFPLIVATPGGALQLASDSKYMFALAKADGFRASQAVLADAPMDADLFALLARNLAGAVRGVARDPVRGRTLALLCCHQYRVRGRHRTGDGQEAIVQALSAVNQRLATLTVTAGV